jgi:hypothetical protein
VSLLNYTTQISVDKTLGQVTAMLVRAGARQVMTEYDESGAPSGLTFSVSTALGVRGFTLPVRAKAIERLLETQRESRYKGVEQSHRVAWRIIKDWLEAQLALIETEMVTFDQVMLPYMRTLEGRTMYDAYVEGLGTRPALGAGS